MENKHDCCLTTLQLSTAFQSGAIACFLPEQVGSSTSLKCKMCGLKNVLKPETCTCPSMLVKTFDNQLVHAGCFGATTPKPSCIVDPATPSVVGCVEPTTASVVKRTQITLKSPSNIEIPIAMSVLEHYKIKSLGQLAGYAHSLIQHELLQNCPFAKTVRDLPWYCAYWIHPTSGQFLPIDTPLSIPFQKDGSTTIIKIHYLIWG